MSQLLNNSFNAYVHSTHNVNGSCNAIVGDMMSDITSVFTLQ